MSEPLVCAICLTKDRPEMVRRAVRCFEQQAYQRKRLIIFDTSKGQITRHRGHFQHCLIGGSTLTIGELRNEANAFADKESIIIHLDSDDYSHPNRFAEQVALLQASGKQVVGYRDMLFWRKQSCPSCDDDPIEGCEADQGEAWLYTNNDPRYCLGTSLCYWRETWEKRPFPAQPKPGKMIGEDVEFLRDRDTLGVSSLFTHGEQKHPDDCKCGTCGPGQRTVIYGGNCEPRMIASIHGGNTSGQYSNIERSGNWRRVPEWDEHCRKVMVL